MSGGRSLRALNALRVHAISAASATQLATDIQTWISANANQRSFVQIDYLVVSTNVVAFITFTE
ncbi:MAG: hypothetical protein ACK5VI_10895 [Opitutia bacterium]|jgi:hypothetical protein